MQRLSRGRCFWKLSPVGCLVLVSCVTKVEVDQSETGTIAAPPVAEFDPQNQIIPLPNNLLLDPTTGKVNLPAQCGETPAAAAIRTGVLNTLDGFGTSKTVIQATFSQPVAAASLAGNVFLFRVATAGVPASPQEPPVPIAIMTGTERRFAAGCTSATDVNDITIVPTVPLEGSSTYEVALLDGIQTTSGAAFSPSVTFALVRQSTPPVTVAGMGNTAVVTTNNTPFDPRNPSGLATLTGLAQLWTAEAPGLEFLDAALPMAAPGTFKGRSSIILAWNFNTESTAAPFDPATPGSPASQLATVPDTLTIAQAIPAAQIPAFYALTLGPTTCALVNCNAIGAIYTGTFVSPNFQTGVDCMTKAPPGPFTDPVHPMKVCDATIPVIVTIPKTPPPATGYKTVIFGHGLNRSKGDLLVLAGQLAAQGTAAIATDAVLHGDRAVRTSMDAAIGCAANGMGNSCTANIDPSCAPQCFVPILTTNLPTTRDNLRQTVLDLLKLERVTRACGVPGACAGFTVDTMNVGYVGQSLGSLLGETFVAESNSVRAAAFSVGGADWVQIVSFTQSAPIRCPFLDALIDAGVLTGQKWNLGMNPNALCLDPNASWRNDPAFIQFATIARWVLDPADPINFTRRYEAPGGPTLTLQEVVGDQVIPNEATEPYAMLLGLSPSAAAVAMSAMPDPTPASVAPPSSFIRYSNIPAMGLFPGNTYAHGSLLQPATPDAAGLLGTAQMQTDVLSFLATHL